MGFTPGGQGGGSFVFIGCDGLLPRTLDVTVYGRDMFDGRLRSPSDGGESTLAWVSEQIKRKLQYIPVIRSIHGLAYVVKPGRTV